MVVGVASSWYSRRGPINPHEFSKEKESNVDRPKHLRTFCDTLLKMYNTALLCISNLYICICVFVVIHRQTVSFYRSSSVCLDMRDASSWERNPADFVLVRYLTPNYCGWIFCIFIYVQAYRLPEYSIQEESFTLTSI